MDEFDRKLKKGLSLLASTGMMKRNYLPPTFPILWRLGVKLPPPHFLSFPAVLFVMGIPFGICWIGLFMAAGESLGWITGVVVLALSVLVPGFLFGGYYQTARRRFRLPLWSEL